MTPSRIRRSESPASNSANLMLDEPPLIVRMRGLAGFIHDSFVITAGHGDINPCLPFPGFPGAEKSPPER